MARRPKDDDDRRAPGTGYARLEKNETWTGLFPRIGGGYHVRRGFSTRARAEAWCDSLLKQRTEKYDVGSGQQRVETCIDRWIARSAKEREWKAKMLADVLYKLGYVKPHLGSMAIVDVMPDHVDAMFDELSKDLAQTTVRQIRNYLYQVFEDARGRRHITFNPVLKPQRRKRAKQKPPQRLNGNQAGILLLTAEQSFYALAWWLIVTLGLRAGEVCGLRRSSFDFEAGTVLIDQEYTDLRGKAHQDSPKNDKIRTLPIPRAMIPRLQLHFHVLTQRAADGTRRGTWKEHQLVFPGKSGKPMNPTSLRHALHDLTDACKLPPVTTHMLRHTAGGFYTSVGAPQEIIGAILGHTPNITGHYAPPPPSAMRPWTDKVYALLSGEVERARRSA